MILLAGASGQLGTALRPLLEARDEVATPTRATLDLDDPATVTRTLDQVRPEVIVNAAAWTAVDAAESDEAAATRANGESVARMAQWADAHGAWLLTFSTDYVFDGRGDQPLTESHPTDPINAYGRGKLVGEQAALAAGSALVVRTAWVVSPTHPNFVRTMLSLFARGIDPRVVDDQHGCPTITGDLAAAVVPLCDTRPTGLLHLTNTGPTTWFEFARAVAGLAGVDQSRVSPCGSEEYPTPAARPAWSVLGSERRAALGIEALPHWQESLPDVVRTQVAALA